MSILFQDGCDLYGTDETKAFAYGWQTVLGSQETVIPTGGRFGGGSFTLFWAHNGWERTLTQTNVTTLFTFAAMKYPTGVYGESTWGFMEWKNDSDQLMARVSLNAAQNVVIRDANGTIQDTSTQQMAPNAWFAVQVKFVAHATTGSIEVWVNGVQWAIATNIDTMPASGNQYFQTVRFGACGPNSAHTEWKDDFAIWDDSGSDFNTWTDGKDLRIDTIRPTADTAQEDFTPQGAGDQYVEVDDSPDHDVDATYNESAGSGDKDRLEAGTITGTPIAIYNVRVRGVAKKTDAGLANAKVGVFSGAAEGVSAAQGLSTDYGFLHHDLPLNPGDSLAWEKADIDAVQLQYEHA
jgi:hypothetical protein